MKILYAIQGTGNGHISRARTIIPLLQKKGEVDILISGTQADVSLDHPIKYRFHGMSFIFGKKGGVDVLATYKKNRIRRFWNEIKSLPVEDYDIVINDFEPVSAWACYLKRKVCVGLSHQAAVLHPDAPVPRKSDKVGQAVLKYYAPTTVRYGFHFSTYDKHIFTPVIRDQVRLLEPTNEGHYTVYLPAYDDDRIVKMLRLFDDIQWDVFSKHNKKPYKEKNVSVRAIENEAFIQSMAASEGVLCGAGFETPAEALHLKKKLLVIPMKGQYEQQCNAAALQEMGVPVIGSLKEKHLDTIGAWLDSDSIIPVNYPEITEQILDTVIRDYPSNKKAPSPDPIPSPKKLKAFILRKILAHLAGSQHGSV